MTVVMADLIGHLKSGMTGRLATKDTMTDILEGLNSRQKEAVTATEGRIRVVAGAGTGKTKALTHRYAYLVNVLGIDPANILCLTFTNKAAAEMRARIAGMVHSGDYNDFVCTIHGFCVKFLRKEIYRIGFPKGFTVSRQLKHYALDFDDLINVTKYILDRFQDACEWWQNELNYIMVDEAQDCNLDDWDLVERLALKHRNLFIVGDPDQAIYEWRGARPDLFVQFAADKTVILDENYRSTPKILDVANCVISNNKNRIPKDLFTRKAEGRAVIHYHGKSEKEETDWIVTQIKLLLQNGAKVNDIAILYRSTYQSRALEQALLNAHLEYTIWGGTRFFERREIKDALSYLRLVNNQDDDLSFERIVNVPSRKLGKKFLDTLRADADRDGVSLFSALQIRDGYGKASAQAFVDLIEDAKAGPVRPQAGHPRGPGRGPAGEPGRTPLLHPLLRVGPHPGREHAFGLFAGHRTIHERRSPQGRSHPQTDDHPPGEGSRVPVRFHLRSLRRYLPESQDNTRVQEAGRGGRKAPDVRRRHTGRKGPLPHRIGRLQPLHESK